MIFNGLSAKKALNNGQTNIDFYTKIFNVLYSMHNFF